MKRITRRDFLKIGTAVSGAFVAGMMQVSAQNLRNLDLHRPNIVILVLDTFSGKHLSANGYARQLTPNLNRFAERATVYHKHYSAGSFTTSGTASLLTGTHPWTHRGTHMAGVVKNELMSCNLFDVLGNDYRCLAFTQNPWVDLLLNQFGAQFKDYYPPSTFSLVEQPFSKTPFARFDHQAFYRALDEFAFAPRPLPGLLSFTVLRDTWIRSRLMEIENSAADQYPYGLPKFIIHPISFLNESVYDGVMQLIDSAEPPFLSYIHLWSPHEPYCPRKEFANVFKGDGFTPIPHPVHPHFSQNVSAEALETFQREYDEYILNVDAEFGRLYDHLQQTGIMDNSYVFILSDHGQLFERGIHGHSTATLYEGVVRVPLMVSAPGQSQCVDIYDPTSNIDLLPTLCALAGKPIPAWVEGVVLPGFGPMLESRSIFSMDAKTNSAFTALQRGSFMLIREGYKLTRYQYSELGQTVSELYDLNADPDETHDLFNSKPATVQELSKELDEALAKANAPYSQG